MPAWNCCVPSTEEKPEIIPVPLCAPPPCCSLSFCSGGGGLCSAPVQLAVSCSSPSLLIAASMLSPHASRTSDRTCERKHAFGESSFSRKPAQQQQQSFSFHCKAYSMLLAIWECTSESLC